MEVGFDRLSYTVAENEILQLCIMFRGPLFKNDSFLELNISLLSDSAGSKLNYCVVYIVEYMCPIGLACMVSLHPILYMQRFCD